MLIKKFLPALVLGAIIGVSAAPAAAGVSYQATDLGVAGTTAGSRLWQYSYHVNGSFDAGSGFTLIYNPTNYANISVTQGLLSTDWLQLGISGFGLTDSTLQNLALDDIANSNNDFKVKFDWLSAGTPGSQPYETFDASGTNTSTLRTVSNSGTVPEPGSLALVAGALVLLGWRNSKLREPSSPVLS